MGLLDKVMAVAVEKWPLLDCPNGGCAEHLQQKYPCCVSLSARGAYEILLGLLDGKNEASVAGYTIERNPSSWWGSTDEISINYYGDNAYGVVPVWRFTRDKSLWPSGVDSDTYIAEYRDIEMVKSGGGCSEGGMVPEDTWVTVDTGSEYANGRICDNGEGPWLIHDWNAWQSAWSAHIAVFNETPTCFK